MIPETAAPVHGEGQEFAPRGVRGRIRGFWGKYERHISAIAFVAGFIFDNLTLRRVDLWVENLVFLIYLAVAGGGIVLFNGYDGGRLQNRYGGQFLTKWLPVAIQFAFGALMSGFFVFYSRSGSFWASWPFMLFLFFLFVGNEIFKKRYAAMTFQVSVFFVVVFSYAIFIVPVILHKLGVAVFLLSGAIGLIALWTELLFIRLFAPERYKKSRPSVRIAALLIFAAFNIFYFTNTIPPIPLALKEIGLYHSVARAASGDYEVTYEPVPWYEFRERWSPVYHRAGYESVYVFSAVFSPTKLNVPIFHVWSYYDEAKEKWIESTRVRFTVFGGRDGGYRGYSVKENISPGQWRVDVITEQGGLIGRIAFRIADVDSLPPLATEVR